MGTQNTEHSWSVGKKRYTIQGIFFPNGSSAIDATKNRGSAGWSVAYTSTGLFTITLADTWLSLISYQANFSVSAATAVFPQWKIGTYSSVSSLILESVNGSGTLTDIAANASNSISFRICLSQDTVVTNG